MKKLFQTSSLVSVLNVSDYTVALTWYSAWLGEPDETPMDGIAVGEIQDWEVVLSCDLHDPDGNKISLAQIISQQ